MLNLVGEGTVSPVADASLYFDWITDRLAIGGRFPIEAAGQLAREHRVRHVVDLRAECCDDEALLEREGISLLHLPTPDHAEIVTPALEQGVAWVSQLVEGGHRVLAHCEHGIGRSALLVLCVLVRGGMAPLDALSLAKARRPRVSPSPRQLDAFIRFAAQSRGQEERWQVPTFDALAAVAYSHLRPAPDGPG